MDYHELRRDYFASASHIGRRLGAGTVTPDPLCRMSERQRKRMRAPNFMTDERWEFRELADRSLIVEISYGRFLDKPLFGVTVCCVGELAADADEWDHALSGAFHDVGAVVSRLAELNEGGRERIAALAACP